MNLEEYFRKGLSTGIIDHSIRVTEGKDGRLEFYIHPDGRDGDTLDFEVCGNFLLAPLNDGDIICKLCGHPILDTPRAHNGHIYHWYCEQLQVMRDTVRDQINKAMEECTSMDLSGITFEWTDIESDPLGDINAFFKEAK